MILPGTEVRLTDLWSSWSFYFPFLKMGVKLSLLQPVATSLDCQVFSHMNVCLLLSAYRRPHLFGLPGWKQIPSRK